jgi:futalosine hydrolase
MMLVNAATEKEMQACLDPLGVQFESLSPLAGRPWARRFGPYVLAVTGAGIPLTLARLLPLSASVSPELIVNIGIAGAYPGVGLAIGEVVAGESECFGDIGIETPDAVGFTPISRLSWGDPAYARPLPLVSDRFGFSVPLRGAQGCTVNACTGTSATGARRRQQTGADFETMEGAAVALAAAELGIPAAELRAISNYASDRDMRPANIALALNALGQRVSDWLGRNQ